MIKMIEIIINNGAILQTEALVAPEQKIIFLNNRKYALSEDFINRLKSIIITWKKEYGYSKGIDDEEFLVTITTEKEIIKYHGKGAFPNNYLEFKRLLGEVNEE